METANTRPTSQKPQMFVPMPHNAQPGKGHRGSLPRFMPSNRAHHGVCSMCSGVQQPAERNGQSGVVCPQCQFFTPNEGVAK